MKKFVLVGLVLGVFLVGCLKQPNLKFSIEKCYEDVGPDSRVAADGVLDYKWLNENTMLIEGFVKTYCGGAEITGDYNIEDNNIILKYDIEVGDAVTRCICLHKLIYEISNLEHNDYSVSMGYLRKAGS